jgi:hypothetical protein
VILIGMLVLLASGVATAQAVPHAALRHYRAQAVSVVGAAYRHLLKRFDALAAREGEVNVDPVVDAYRALADSFDVLDAGWARVHAPKGLRTRHRGMGRVFALFASAIRIHADALFTRHPEEIAAARPKVEARLRSAAYLQYRWAAALRGALVRAALRVPVWLAQMANP